MSTRVEGAYFSKTVQSTGTKDDWWSLFVCLLVAVVVLFLPFVIC